MKHWIITTAIGIVAFVGGCVAGWEARKKTEVTFDIVSEEELNEFAKNDQADNANAESSAAADAGTDTQDSSSKGFKEAVDTAKRDYAKRWRDEYTIKSSPFTGGEDPVISGGDEDGDEEIMINPQHNGLPTVEESDEVEYNTWAATFDGEYEAMELNWYSKDSVLTDSDDDPIDHPTRYLGFDPQKEFSKAGIAEEAGGVIYMKNNVLQVVFCISKYPISYSHLKSTEEYGGGNGG